MSKTPTEQQVHDAEMRVAASRERTRAAVFNFRGLVDSKRAEFHARIHRIEARLTKPSALAIAVGVGVVIGKTIMRGKRRRLKPAPRQAVGGLIVTVGALISRFGWRFLPSTLLRLFAARRPYASAAPRPAARLPLPRAVAAQPNTPVARNAGDTVH